MTNTKQSLEAWKAECIRVAQEIYGPSVVCDFFKRPDGLWACSPHY